MIKHMENSCIIIIYLHIYGLRIDPNNDLLPVDLIVQLAEHCTGNPEVRVRIPIQGPVSRTFRNFSGDINPSVSFIRTRFKLWNFVGSYFAFPYI